jgi:C4-dicarboxylate-specific signal transduction histidine kinase
MDGLFAKYNNDIPQNFRELAVITKISQSIIKNPDYDEVLQIISDGMAELLGIEKGAMYILESETKLYLEAATPPIAPDLPDVFRRTTIEDHPHIEASISSRKPVLISDTQTEILSEAEKQIIELSNVSTVLYFPFIREEKAIGILILSTSEKSKKYSERQIELGQTIANQLSVAIQNSQLHRDLKNHNDNLERLVAERTNELKKANEELQATNNKLLNKNEIVIQQKKDIEIVLKNLKSTQFQLIQSEKMASIGVLTAGVAHEINNPLNFIMGGYTGLCNELKTHDVDKDKRISIFLNGIKTGIDRTADIVKGLNQLSRDNDNYNEQCEIHAIIDNCLAILHHKYKNRIEIIKNYSLENQYIMGNTGKLHQVFISIISNAIDAIENDGAICIDTISKDKTIEVSIKDTGCGIPAMNLKKIIDPFFTTKDPGKGTGLGLSISNTIIKRHKGHLHFDSEPGKGARVLIQLPKTIYNE